MRLNEIFCDGAVFAANKPIRIFGTGGGLAEIEFFGKSYSAEMVGAKWEMELPPMPYGGPYEMNVTLDGRKQTLHDIYIGDVYLLAGQSNMQFKLKESDYGEDMRGDDWLLRLFSTERVSAGESFFVQDGWVKAKKTNAGEWSCIGYFVGKELRKRCGHAVGLIACYQGAADIQAYLPDSAFSNPSFAIPDDDRFDMEYPWNEGHSQLYNFQLKQVIPYQCTAVLWYQGESNVPKKESAVYGDMLSCLFESWRAAFKDKELPFVVVQIADFVGRDHAFWHKIQQIQEEIQHKEKNVITVVSRDVCESTDIHLKKKYELAMRIADVAADKKWRK